MLLQKGWILRDIRDILNVPPAHATRREVAHRENTEHGYLAGLDPHQAVLDLPDHAHHPGKDIGLAALPDLLQDIVPIPAHHLLASADTRIPAPALILGAAAVLGPDHILGLPLTGFLAGTLFMAVTRDLTTAMI